MSNNTTTDGEFVTEPPAETFHIYILSFSYGFLLVRVLERVLYYDRDSDVIGVCKPHPYLVPRLIGHTL